MKPSFPYSFEAFQDHLAAMPIAMKSEHLLFTDPPTEVSALNPDEARFARIIDYFRDIYGDGPELARKADAFILIQDYISGHFRWFKFFGLATSSQEKGKLVASHGLLRAVHFAVTKLGSDTHVSKWKIVKLARAINAIYPGA